MKDQAGYILTLLAGILIGVLLTQRCPEQKVVVVEREVVREVEKPTPVTPQVVTQPVIVQQPVTPPTAVTPPVTVTEVVTPPPITPPAEEEEEAVVVTPPQCPDVNLPIKVSLVSAPKKLTNKKQVRFRFSHSIKFICSIDDIQQECTKGFSAKLKEDGEKTFKVSLNYLEGCTKDLLTYTFKVDTTPPETRIIPIGFKELVTADVARFKIEVNEPYVALLCRVDGAFWFECGPTIELTDLTEGWHIIEAYALDLAQNEESPPKSYKFRVDARPPVVKITSKPPKETTSRVAIFEFEANEPDVVFECDIDNTGWRKCTSPFRAENLTPGQHIFKVRGKDVAGRISEPAVWVWTVK